MNAVERVESIKAIARELDERYNFDDIDIFLKAHGFSAPQYYDSNNRIGYVKEIIQDAKNQIIQSMLEDLNIVTTGRPLAVIPPKIWSDRKKFALFISHLAVEKQKAHRLKSTLEKYNISSFVAHDDIEPTRPWQTEIEKALWNMDAMLVVLTKGFSQSVWTQQEIGFALGRGVKVISLRMDEDPKGFVSKDQAILRRSRTAEQISEEINTILVNDPMTKTRMSEVNSLMKKHDDDEVPF